VNTSGQITLRQWRKLSERDRNARVLFFRAALRALWLNPDRTETDRYLDLNDAVNDLWPTVPWTVHTAEYWTAKAYWEWVPCGCRPDPLASGYVL
jgi:hypothetical protein